MIDRDRTFFVTVAAMYACLAAAIIFGNTTWFDAVIGLATLSIICGIVVLL